MKATGAAGSSWHYVPRRKDNREIVHDYERSCTAAGVLLAVAFGAMLVIGAWLGW